MSLPMVRLWAVWVILCLKHKCHRGEVFHGWLGYIWDERGACGPAAWQLATACCISGDKWTSRQTDEHHHCIKPSFSLCALFSKSDNVVFEYLGVMWSFMDMFRLMRTWVANMKFDCRFVFSRLPQRLQHRAVKLAYENSLGEFLFPTSATACNRSIPIIPLDRLSDIK